MMPRDVKSLYLKDFLLLHTGYEKRHQREINQTRHIMAYIKRFGGMGCSEVTQPKDIWPLPMDSEYEKKPVTSLRGAMAMLKEFKECLSIVETAR